MAPEQHWTEDSSDAFAHRLAFDFIAQIEKKMEALRISQIEMARRLKISEGAVSKLLNNPQNLTLRTIAKYSRALGMKAAIVAYDDGDSQNSRGPIISEIFTTCWERAGKPHDMWTLNASQLQQSATTAGAGVLGIGSKTTSPSIASFPDFVFVQAQSGMQRESTGHFDLNVFMGTIALNNTTVPVFDCFTAKVGKKRVLNPMPEVQNYTFEHTELAEILVRKLDIHEGFWGVFIEFAFSAATVPAGPDGKLLPASLNFVKKIGIQRFEERTNLTVDAAESNPIAKKKR